MRRLSATLILLAATGALAAAPPASPPAAPPQAPLPAKPRPDAKVMQLQVVLDQLGFGPGVIDGRTGQSLKLSLAGFQKANALSPTGTLDPATAEALARYAQVQPVSELTLTEADLAGQFVGPIPRGEDKQALLPTLGYQNALEMLAERYHTTPDTLIALNSPATKLVPGSKIRVPNVATTARDYPPQLRPDWKATLAGLNVAAGQPLADHVVVSKSKKSLSVYDAQDKLIAQFPVTTGSTHDPLPLGTWKILGADYNPKFHYNPKLFWDANKTDKKAMLPPGPNGPVGVVWLDLSKDHYGIHGTPEPQNIGRTASHGCVRMTNWDVARLSLMVKPSTKAVFEA